MSQQKTNFLKVGEVAERIGFSQSWVWNITNEKSKTYDPLFPGRISIANGSTRWNEAEVQAWQDARINGAVSSKALVSGTAENGSSAPNMSEAPTPLKAKKSPHSADITDINTKVDETSVNDAVHVQLQKRRTETVREVLQDKVKRGEYVYMEDLMSVTMLSMDESSDVKLMEEILNALTEESHLANQYLIGALVIYKKTRLTYDSFLSFARTLGYKAEGPGFCSKEIERMYMAHERAGHGKGPISRLHLGMGFGGGSRLIRKY